MVSKVKPKKGASSIRHITVVEVLTNQNLFTKSNLGDSFLSDVEFHSGGSFSKRAAAAQ